jgi:hypothetical protein
MIEPVKIQITKKQSMLFSYLIVFGMGLTLISIWLFSQMTLIIAGVWITVVVYQALKTDKAGELIILDKTWTIKFENEPDLIVKIKHLLDLKIELNHYQYEPPTLLRAITRKRNYSGYENSIKFSMKNEKFEYHVFIGNGTRLEKLKKYFYE